MRARRAEFIREVAVYFSSLVWFSHFQRVGHLRGYDCWYGMDMSPRYESRQADARLPLLQLADWSEERPYDEERPTCIHYSIEWKLTINSKGVSKDTEQNLVLAPGAFWRTALCAKLEKLLHKKMPPNKSFKADDTNITVSVTDRSQRDLVKCFDELAVDWNIVEKQLQAWSQEQIQCSDDEEGDKHHQMGC
jgi:hypothetical protein